MQKNSFMILFSPKAAISSDFYLLKIATQATRLQHHVYTLLKECTPEDTSKQQISEIIGIGAGRPGGNHSSATGKIHFQGPPS